MNLTTIENVKGYLSISSATDDALFDRLIDSASGYIQTWLNRSFAVATYTDTFNGTGHSTYMVSNFPINTITSVIVDTVSIPLATSTLASGYSFAPRKIVLRGYAFNTGLLNCSVTYTAGFATVPPEIGQACIEMVANRYREKDRIGLISKGLSGESIAFSQKDFPDSTRTILNSYKKVIPT
jgi:hypothetical protein